MMIECFTGKGNATPIILVTADRYAQWKKGQSKQVTSWLESISFRGEAGDLALLPGEEGELSSVVFICEPSFFWEFASVPQKLPLGTYALEASPECAEVFALAWALESYRFNSFKTDKKPREYPTLVWPQGVDQKSVENTAEATFWLRDLINRPANDLTPQALAEEATKLAKEHKAQINVVAGEDLLKENFPAIYAVGQAGSPPHLIDMAWGDIKHPKVTLVGKGVCFDTGGLDIKPAAGMKLMKKDMGGAAHVLALAKMIMTSKLPIHLRVIVGAVENSISGNAMRPGDVVNSRKGLTIEIGHTDAEGRVVLADCLSLAAEQKPELIIDCATLTGSARVALGADLPALFSNDTSVSNGLLEAGQAQNDPLWPMPLWQGYKPHIKGKVADLSNEASTPYGGAITAALFLEHFVEGIPWVHIDMMAWNSAARPGRPEGGEAAGLRGMYVYLKRRYA